MTLSKALRCDPELSPRLWPGARASNERWTAQACASDLQAALPSIDADASSEAVLAFFAAHVGQYAVAVVESGRPLGLISKARFAASYLPQRHRPEDGRRGCLQWMTPRVMVVDGRTGLAELLLHARTQRAPLDDGFIVTEGGRYLGLASSMALRMAVLDLETLAQRERLASMGLALPMQRHLQFLTHEQLCLGLADHHVLREASEPVAASGVFARTFHQGTLLVVLEGRNQGQGCFKTQVSAQLWMDADLQAVETSGEDVDPGPWLQRLHGHLLRDREEDDRQAGVQGGDLTPWRLGDGLKVAAIWLPRGGQLLRFAGSRMDLVLVRPGSRQTQVLRGAPDLLGSAAAPDAPDWCPQDLPLGAVHRALVVTDGITDQCGGPFAEPLGTAMLTGFMRSHSTLNARDIGPLLTRFVDDWRGSCPAPADLAGLVFSVGGKP